MIHPNYPRPEEIHAWCDEITEKSAARSVDVRPLDVPQYTHQLGVPHTAGNHYLAFQTDERTFYGYWQPASAGPAPVLFHVPGYGAEMSAHPGLVAEGFNVLHINPLGYCTPEGPVDPQLAWPVMPDSVKTHGRAGYVDWLSDAVLAATWALGEAGVEPSRFGFFGSSQGGGTALLLASIFRDRGVRAVSADVPYLTNYPLMHEQEDWGAYHACFDAMPTPEGTAEEWRALGFIDTLSHAHRLTVPTLLTAGDEDTVTPAVSIESLFEALPGTRSYTLLSGHGHGYTAPFIALARAWFKLYV